MRVPPSTWLIETTTPGGAACSSDWPELVDVDSRLAPGRNSPLVVVRVCGAEQVDREAQRHAVVVVRAGPVVELAG